jgi:glycosyltransferase involved in cell wall biosynthesis
MAPHQDLAAFVELRRMFRDLRPDVVHTHNPKPGVYGRLAARAARVPVVVNTVHGLYALPEDRWTKRAVVYGLERIAARASDAELVQNAEDVPVLRRLGIRESKLTILGNGVDLERFRPDRLDAGARRARRAEWDADDDTVVVGTVGRLVWEKGYRELFAAARSLVGHRPRIRFVIIGGLDAAKSDQLGPADLAAASRDADLVGLGHRDDVADLYGAMDVFVLASHREGFPRAAMEAAASGLPVVATDIRGCRQVVDPGRTGLLVAPRDATALAAALARIADDAEVRAAMSDASLVKARADFDDRRVVATTLATYDRLLATHS